MELPDELWNLIIDFALNFKKSHKMKLEHSLKLIEGMYDSFWYESDPFPPWSKRYIKYQVPEELEVPLVSIAWNPEKKIWIYGYGWCKYYLEN